MSDHSGFVFPAGFAKEWWHMGIEEFVFRERSGKDCREEARTEETTAEQSKIASRSEIREQEGCRLFLGSCCQTPMSVSLLASNKGVCVINEKHRCRHWKSGPRKVCYRTLSGTLLFLMAFSSSDLLPPS